MQLITQDGRAFPLRPGINTIGRSMDNMIVLNYTSISRRHAQLRWDTAGVTLADTNSVNGTAVDGQRLAPGQWQPLYPGSHIQFGMEVTAQIVAASAQPPIHPAAAPLPVTQIAAFPATQGAHYPPHGLAPGAGANPVGSLVGGSPRIESPVPALGAGRGLSGGLELLLRAVDISLDRRKLLLTLGGITIAGLLAFLAFTIASGIQRESASLSLVFLILGALLAWLVMALTSGAITQMCHADLTGRPRVTIREAIRYALRRWAEFAFAPLALGLLLAAIGLGEVIILLAGRVDYLGELVDTLLFLPAVVLNLFLVVATAFGASLVYPIIVDRGRGIGGTISFVLLLVRHTPARIIFYLGVAGLLAVVATAVVLFLVATALLLTLSFLTIGLGMGKSVAVLSSHLLDLIPGAYGLGEFGLGRMFGAERFTYRVASLLIQAALLVVVALALAFPLVLQMSLACAVYLNVKGDVSPQARLV
jgi:hypothetical protein